MRVPLIVGLWFCLVTLAQAVPPQQDTVRIVAPSFHLPTFCRQYYDDGTGRWIECMGVGLK